ncbi:MAG: hypothetical protein ACYC9O_02030 [Candidatus Latescibacterota bacterium]
MKITRWQLTFGILLVALSLILFFVQAFLFRKPDQQAFYFFQDLAFLPIEVLLVTVIVKRFLNEREKRDRLHKMNMVIGAFFNEVGTDLIDRYFSFLPDSGDPKDHLLVSGAWTGKRFDEAVAFLRKREFAVDSRRGNLESLKQYLLEKRKFLLRLLENPNLLENDTFTDLLWAVFHLTEELNHRLTFTGLPEPDYDHLSVDMRRVYTLLLTEWLSYMRHLKSAYPYLFSLAVRTNPFDPDASVIIGKDERK